MKKYKDLECILLVDDNQSTNFLHEFLIKKTKIDTQVQVAKDGITALEYLTSDNVNYSTTNNIHPGIILLDLNMPEMNGWEFLEEFKKLPKEQKNKTIILMVTSSINEDDKKLAASFSDITDFICKPINQVFLQKTIDSNFELIQ